MEKTKEQKIAELKKQLTDAGLDADKIPEQILDLAASKGDDFQVHVIPGRGIAIEGLSGPEGEDESPQEMFKSLTKSLAFAHWHVDNAEELTKLLKAHMDVFAMISEFTEAKKTGMVGMPGMFGMRGLHGMPGMRGDTEAMLSYGMMCFNLGCYAYALKDEIPEDEPETAEEEAEAGAGGTGEDGPKGESEEESKTKVEETEAAQEE